MVKDKYEHKRHVTQPNTQKTDLREQSLPRDFERPTDAADDSGLDTANRILDAALDKKAIEPILLDVRELCGYTDYLFIVSGRSDRQVDAITDGVKERLGKQGIRPLGVEGVGSGQWALLDYGDVVVHVFHHPVRERYDLEGLWIDAKRVDLDVPDEARASAEDLY